MLLLLLLLRLLLPIPVRCAVTWRLLKSQAGRQAVRQGGTTSRATARLKIGNWENVAQRGHALTPFVLALPQPPAAFSCPRIQRPLAKCKVAIAARTQPSSNRPFVRLSLGHCNAINLPGAAERKRTWRGGWVGEDTGNLHALKCNLCAFPGRGLPCNIPLRYATWHRCHTVHSARRRSSSSRRGKPCHCPCLNGRIEGRLIGSPAETVSRSLCCGASFVGFNCAAFAASVKRLASLWSKDGTSWHASFVL